VKTISQFPTLPLAPKPPDDPLHLLLNAQTGWRRTEPLTGVEISPEDGSLCLSPNPVSARPLVDSAGTFGGLDLPTGVASDGGGGIYLLDAASGKIKRFDPCECRFEVVPCSDGIGEAPRQFQEPHGIAVFAGDLFVCDTGNSRVQVFALKSMTLRALWPTPAAAELTQPWQPFDIGFDTRGRAFITDTANGVIHRFDRQGNWQMNFGPLNQPTHLAIDQLGKIYVIQFGADEVSIFDRDGKFLKTESRPENVKVDFPATGITTDAEGHLYLADWCMTKADAAVKCEGPRPTETTSKIFDIHGDLIDLTFARALPVFAQEGLYLSEPLDSEIYRCQWHRVVLEGDIPNGATVKVESFTTEVTLDSADLGALPATAWHTQQTAGALSEGAWDCLITEQRQRNAPTVARETILPPHQPEALLTRRLRRKPDKR
jgi:DNA-binding beta-propeller fold protein YncE